MSALHYTDISSPECKVFGENICIFLSQRKNKDFAIRMMDIEKAPDRCRSGAIK